MIRAYDLGGASRGQAPAPLSVEWVARENELATLKVSYSELAPRSAVLDGVVEVAYLVPTEDGQGWVEPPNARMRVEGDGWERLADGARVHSYDFVSLAAEFSHHYLTQGATAERTFGSVTAGAIVEAFVAEVQADGGLPWLTLGFTPTTDSRGEAWPHYLENGSTDGTQVQTEVVPLRTKDLLTLLQGLARVQWWMEGRTLHVAPWKPGAAVPVYLPDGLMTESPEKINHGGVYSHVRIVGDEGAHWLFPVPGANPAYGKRIKVVQSQGVTSEAQAALLAETEYPAARDAAESFTRAWRVMDGTPWVPGRDLQLGDKITADTKAGRRIEARIAGMSVKEDKAGRSAFVTLGTVQDGLLLRMAKQSRQQQGGVGVIYGTPKPVPPAAPGTVWPEKPHGLTARILGWPLQTGHGGKLEASWDEVTTDTGGAPLDVDQYTVRARKQGGTWEDPVFRTGPGVLSGAAEVKGGAIPGDTWEVQVAAMEGDDTGTWSDVVTVTVLAGSEISWPNVPGGQSGSATTTWTDAGYRGVVTMSWLPVTHGLDGSPVEITNYSILARRTSGAYEIDWFHVGSSGGALTWTGGHPEFLVGDVWEFGVAAYSREGHTGGWPDPGFEIVIPPDATAPEVPAAPLVSSELGRLSVRSTGTTSTGGPFAGDLSHFHVYLDGIAEPFRMDPIALEVSIGSGSTGPLTLGNAYVARLASVDLAGNESALSQPGPSTQVVSAISGLQAAIDQVEADFAAADQALQNQIDSIVVSESGGIVTWMGGTTPVAPTERPHMAGDLWWDTATKTQKRYDGSTWVAHQLGDAAIADFNASKLFGYVEAARIKVDTQWITEKLLIGNTDEVVIDPAWGNADLNSTRARTGWTVAPGTVTHTQAVAEVFYLGLTSAYSTTAATFRMQLRPGQRYLVTATVQLTAAGSVGLVAHDIAGNYTDVDGPHALGAGVPLVLSGEHVWGAAQGAFGVRLTQPGTITNVSVRPMLSQVLIADGLIQTPMLAAGSVQGDVIAGGTITGAKIAATLSIEGKLITGGKIVGNIWTTTNVANRGIWINGTDNTLKSFNLTTGAEEFRLESGNIFLSGDIQTQGIYPRVEIKRNLPGLGPTWAAIRWSAGPDWQTFPEIATNSAKWGVDMPGSLYVRGGNRHGLTMRPEVALRSGRPVNGADQFWPEVDIVVGLTGQEARGRRRLQDVGQDRTAIYDFADFWKAETRGGGMMIEMPVPGTVHDISVRSLSGGITLRVGNGWLRPEGIGSTTGGEDLALEGNWRMTYRSSLSADKLEQEPLPVAYELLNVQPKSWVDRVRREMDPGYAVRYAGFIAEELQAANESSGGKLRQTLVHRNGRLHSISLQAIVAHQQNIIADMHRRITRLEGAVL